MGFLNTKMDNGWVKIHRKIQDWEWYQDSKMVHLFLHFLMLANHDKGQWHGQTIERGQFITGRIELSKQTGITQQSIRTCITKLKLTNEITTKSTNQFTIITILKYGDYQLKDKSSTSKLTNESTNEQPTTNHKQEVKKKEEDVTKPPNEVNLLLGKFQKTINNHIKFNNITERKACEDLIKTYGLEVIIKNLAIVNEYQKKDKYFPQVTTPYELWVKWPKIINYFERNDL